MAQQKANILILEDDETVLSSLKEALSRAGHIVHTASRPDEAEQVLTREVGLDFIFCDCLIPQMMGLDFIKKVREKYPSKTFKVVLMSGIYTDRNFIQEATQASKAVAFLKKPFEIQQILKIVQRDESEKVDKASARKLLYQIFANPSVSSRQKRKVIESIEEINGFDLPFIYSLLAETNSDGYLNIYHDNGSLSGVSFSKGNIVGVDVEDKSTFLGEMLIQSGYATPQAVQEALRDKNHRRIGNYLIQSNQLSPHAFDLVLMEQMNIRLASTIGSGKIRIDFSAAEVESGQPSIDPDSLSAYLHDWVASKISVSWLKSLYALWSENVITKSPSFREDHPALKMPLVQSLEGFAKRLSGSVTIAQLLQVDTYREAAVYKAIHFLLTKGLIVFARRSSFANPAEQLKVLQKIMADLDKKNPYEIVSYVEAGTGAGSEPDLLQDFLSLIGEEPVDTTTVVYKQWHRVKKHFEEALRASKDSQKIDQMRAAQLRSEVEAKIKASALLEEVKKCLHLNQCSQALKLLNEVAKLQSEAPQFHLYSAWAKLGTVESAKRALVLKDVELHFVQVPPEERYDAVFAFVVGLFSKIKGDFPGARKSFEKSVAMDSSFIPPRRELSLLTSLDKKQDVFNVDLKKVVAGFFSKR